MKKIMKIIQKYKPIILSKCKLFDSLKKKIHSKWI